MFFLFFSFSLEFNSFFRIAKFYSSNIGSFVSMILVWVHKCTGGCSSDREILWFLSLNRIYAYSCIDFLEDKISKSFEEGLHEYIYKFMK